MEFRNVCSLYRYASVLIIAGVFGCSQAHSRGFYTAAVYEHSRQGDGTTDSVETVIRTNLEYYERAAMTAGEQEADIIVFPEYGIIYPPGNRSEMKKCLELVPNPKEVTVTPCDEAELFAESPIMYSLSCMAKMNKIVVVANLASIEHCEDEDGCPDDGALYLNTNVAFDKNGTLLARYYKEYLYFEIGMDLPREKQDPIFETEFGKFAMFICFDILFEKMAITSQLKEIDAILFPTLWFNSSPFFTSTQWFQSWAMGNNATLLAANIQIPGHSIVGSGIFRGRKGSVVHAFSPDGISKLIVATLPKGNQDILSTTKITAILRNGTEEWSDNGKSIPRVCSYGILGKAEDIYKDYRCFTQNVVNYTLVKLYGTEDHLEVCNNNMCCELEYVASSMNASFYLGVYNGTHNSSNKYFWSEENCFLARCDDVNGTACSDFPTMSETFFHRISMTANFTSKIKYPSFVSSGMKLVPTESWTFDSNPDKSYIEMNSSSGIQLIAATLKGRAYDRDPPYIR